MSAGPNTSGAFSLLFYLVVKYVNNLQKVTQYFDTHTTRFRRILEADSKSNIIEIVLFMFEFPCIIS